MGKRSSRTPANVNPNENKADKFVRVVSPRVSKAVKAIGLIGNCAGSSYLYTTKQTTEIHNALVQAVEQIDDQFAKKQARQTGFEFGT